MNQSISIDQLKQQLQQQPLNIIDIRDNYQYQLGSIPTAINVPMNFLLMMPEKYLTKDKLYYLCCEFGTRSRKACFELSKMGYQVRNIEGGYQEYKIR